MNDWVFSEQELKELLKQPLEPKAFSRRYVTGVCFPFAQIWLMPCVLCDGIMAGSGSPLHLVFITCLLYHGALIISHVGYLCSLVLLHYWLNNSRSTQLGKCQRKEVRDLVIKAIIFLKEVG